MAKLKQWLGWIVFCGVIPTVAFLIFARHMRQHEAAFYLIGVPLLLIYFYILGMLKLDIPGAIWAATPEDVAYSILGSNITAERPLGKVIGWLRGVMVLLVMPALGAGLIFYGVRDGEKMGYILGPGLIWVSGGCWSLLTRFFRERKRITP